MSSRCHELHEMHRAIAAQRDRVFSLPDRHVSISVKAKDVEWSSVLELACAEADGKFAINIQCGLRNEVIERLFEAPSHSLSLSKYLTVDPSIDMQLLADRLVHTIDELDQLSGEIASVETLLEIVEAQGGSTIVFGSWTQDFSFPAGRTASEIRRALR